MGRWRCRVLPAPCGGRSVSRRWCRAVVLGVFCVVVVVPACGRQGSAGPASASSALVSSASASVSLSQDELYAEAERVYRAYFELEQRAFLEGGVNGVPVEMNQYIMGKYSLMFSDILAQMAKNGWRMKPGTREQIGMMRNAPEMTGEDSVVTIRVCIDSNNSPLVDSNGVTVGAGFDLNSVFFKYDNDGNLKIYGSTGESVDSCDVS